jgi:hypothetical protein
MAEEETPPLVNLNVTDISDAVKVIDHAAEQGAFKGWTNIRQILGLRDRLDAFVTAATAVTEQPSEPAAEQPEPKSTPEPKSYPRRQKVSR